MKHCDAIDFEMTATGAVFRGSRWPAEINVDRNLLDYLPGPHVQFGRYGVLRFNAINGYAVYRRLEDVPGGWNYRLVESNLNALPPVLTALVEPVPVRAEREYVAQNGVTRVNAFQWLPHAVPPVALPDWFHHADFEHNAVKGELLIRQSGRPPLKVEPSDWIVRHHGIISVIKAAKFTAEYQEAA